MNFKNQKNRKLYFVIGTSAFILLIVAICIYYFLVSKPKSTIPQQSQYPVSSSSSGDSSSNTTVKEPSNTANTTPSEDIPQSPAGSVAITNLNQQNGYVNALAEVSAFTPSQCVYTFTSEGSKPVTREQKGGCSGVSILEDEFDKVGTYTLTVSVYGNNQKLTTSKDIYIK